MLLGSTILLFIRVIYFINNKFIKNYYSFYVCETELNLFLCLEQKAHSVIMRMEEYWLDFIIHLTISYLIWRSYYDIVLTIKSKAQAAIVHIAWPTMNDWEQVRMRMIESKRLISVSSLFLSIKLRWVVITPKMLYNFKTILQNWTPQLPTRWFCVFQ